MKIDISSVSFLSDGREVLLRISISNGENIERKKLILPSEKYIEYSLCKGKKLDEELFDELSSLSENYRAIKKGSELLAYSSQSRAELSRKLKMKGFNGEQAENAVDYLVSKNMIDEDSNIDKLISSCLKKLWGKKRIYAELVKKGYDKNAVSEKLRTLGQDDMIKNCISLINKKWGDIPGELSEINKIINSLLRYGYSYGEIRSALETFGDTDL